MMNGLGKEIMLCKARLAEEKREREKKLERVDAAVTVIREIIDPYDLDNIASWDMDKFSVISQDLYATWMEIREHDRKIAVMEKDLHC
jgi:hypothetical protein